MPVIGLGLHDPAAHAVDQQDRADQSERNVVRVAGEIARPKLPGHRCDCKKNEGFLRLGKDCINKQYLKFILSALPHLVEPLSLPYVWRGEDLATEGAVLPSGHAALDAQLPGGGWPVGSMVEVLQERAGQHVWQLVL